VDAEAQWESLDLAALERAARLRGLCITGAVRRIVLGRLRRYERYLASLGEDIDGVALEEPNPAVARPGVHDGEELSSSELAELRDLQRGHRFRRLLLLDTAVLVQDLDQPEVTTGSSNWVSTAADAPAAPILAAAEAAPEEPAPAPALVPELDGFEALDKDPESDADGESLDGAPVVETSGPAAPPAEPSKPSNASPAPERKSDPPKSDPPARKSDLPKPDAPARPAGSPGPRGEKGEKETRRRARSPSSSAEPPPRRAKEDATRPEEKKRRRARSSSSEDSRPKRRRPPAKREKSASPPPKEEERKRRARRRSPSRSSTPPRRKR